VTWSGVAWRGVAWGKWNSTFRLVIGFPADAFHNVYAPTFCINCLSPPYYVCSAHCNLLEFVILTTLLDGFYCHDLPTVKVGELTAWRLHREPVPAGHGHHFILSCNLFVLLFEVTGGGGGALIAGRTRQKVVNLSTQKPERRKVQHSACISTDSNRTLDTARTWLLIHLETELSWWLNMGKWR
jgi:hypothetical protein